MFHPDGPTFLELMKQALASTERGYDMIAPKFDHTPFRTPGEVLGPMVGVIGEVRSALDVCCGTGAAMRVLRPHCTERVVGIDFSQGMLDEARRRLADAPGDARVELVRGDALELPFDDEFDIVTSVGAFGHVLPEDEDRFVAGIARALVTGGRFVFVTAEAPTVGSRGWWMSHGFNAVMRVRNAVLSPQFIMYYLTFLWPDVHALLERHGFDVAVKRGLCPAPYGRAIVVIATKR
ncbi:MAG: methyltransferase domain-containing protein [Myxococcales bacterium]|nr:methyltransferase domain-containing protein [Myxococcales bacterium]